MTRDEFLTKWCFGSMTPWGTREEDEQARADLDSLLSSARREAMEEAAQIPEGMTEKCNGADECGCNELMAAADAIRSLSSPSPAKAGKRGGR
jgi:hypothetical protein